MTIAFSFLLFQAMSKKMFIACVSMVVFFPVAFYFPKFFEYRYDRFVHIGHQTINCTKYVIEQEELARISLAFDDVRTKFISVSITKTLFDGFKLDYLKI
jgi:hypothetical protein